jgi:hypothetical protein
MGVAAPIAAAAEQGRVVGRPFSKGVSGNPDGKASVREHAAALFYEMSADFGTLGAVETVLLRRAALLLARSESIRSTRDADVSLRMSSEARRTLMTLRRHHAAAPRDTTPSLSDILRAEAEAADEANDAPVPEVVDTGTLTSDHASAAVPSKGDGKAS